MSRVITIENESHLQEIINQNENVVVDFFATWCGPCKMLLPVLDSVSTEMDNITICKVNVEENKPVAMSHNVSSIPTVFYYKNGAIVSHTLGYYPKDKFVSIVNEKFNL